MSQTEQTLLNGQRYFNLNATKALIARSNTSDLNEAPLSKREPLTMA